MRAGAPAGDRPVVARTYLVESYWPGVTEAIHADRAERVEAAARALRATGSDIEFLGTVLIPSDEVAFWRFASATRDGVEQASSEAGLAYDRVLECVELSAAAARQRSDRG
jgi:hypothetical protein